MCAIRPQGSVARRTIPWGTSALRARIVGAVFTFEETPTASIAVVRVLGVDAVPTAALGDDLERVMPAVALGGPGSTGVDTEEAR